MEPRTVICPRRSGQPPATAGLVGLTPHDAAPSLPRCLQLRPVVALSDDLRPRGVRFALGPKQVVLPSESFEHFVSILAGHPDPDNMAFDYICHDSATSEACRLRASVGRMRDRFEEAFADETDASLARAIVVTLDRDKAYVLHPALRVQLLPSVKAIPTAVLRREILDKLLAKFPPENS